jgi:hypothetical protein
MQAQNEGTPWPLCSERHLMCSAAWNKELAPTKQQKTASLLMFAAQEGRLDVVRCLVRSLAPTLTKQGMMFHLYFLAAQHGHLTCSAARSRPEQTQIEHDRGVTPLMVFPQCKHAEIVSWLVKAGANTRLHGWLHVVLHRTAAFRALVPLPSRPRISRPRRTARAPAAAVRGLLKCTGASRQIIAGAVPASPLSTQGRLRWSASWRLGRIQAASGDLFL